MSDVLPRLRPVEAFPVEHEGQRMIALRDPSGYTPSVVLLPGPLLEIVSLFDGDHTVIDVQATVMRQHGEIVTAAELESVVARLDEHGSLHTPRFAARLARIHAGARGRRHRPGLRRCARGARPPRLLRGRARPPRRALDRVPGGVPPVSLRRTT